MPQHSGMADEAFCFLRTLSFPGMFPQRYAEAVKHGIILLPTAFFAIRIVSFPCGAYGYAEEFS
mgnify:CR=1 FL=1